MGVEFLVGAIVVVGGISYAWRQWLLYLVARMQAELAERLAEEESRRMDVLAEVVNKKKPRVTGARGGARLWGQNRP